MNNEIKTTIVKIGDKYNECLEDKISQNKSSKLRSPKGFVEIYEINEKGEKQLVGKSNLVVYLGREWLASRAFNSINSAITQTPLEYICWFGLGDAGCFYGDPLTPIPPTVLDTDLGNKIIIGSEATYADPDGSGNFYKHPINSISFIQDSENNDSYLIVQSTITISMNDANGYNLNEAGLYSAESNSGGYTGPFHLFSKVTFPTLVKTSSRELDFIWFIYF